MKIKHFLGRLRNALRGNIVAKIAAVIFALLLWNYVMSATDVPRALRFENMNVTLNGEASLNRAGLALRDNPLTGLDDVMVEINVPGRVMTNVSRGNISVSLNVATITEAGEAELSLSASSSYGQVKSITPEKVTVTVEPLISKWVPVEAVMTGVPEENIWYGPPTFVSRDVRVSGPQSIVDNISAAQVEINLTGIVSEYRALLRFKLVDHANEALETEQLDMDAEVVTVSFRAAPQKEYDLSTIPLYYGRPADGYRVKSATIEPKSVLLAAPEDILSALPQDAAQLALLEPMDISALDHTVTLRPRLSLPEGVINSSSTEVFITIEIEADTAMPVAEGE